MPFTSVVLGLILTLLRYSGRFDIADYSVGTTLSVTDTPPAFLIEISAQKGISPIALISRNENVLLSLNPPTEQEHAACFALRLIQDAHKTLTTGAKVATDGIATCVRQRIR